MVLGTVKKEAQKKHFIAHNARKRWPRRWGPQGVSPTGGDGLAKVPNQRVCKHPFLAEWHMQGREGWINILPWYRLVGDAKGGRAELPQKGKWPPRGTILTYPGSAPRKQARLVKTVNIQVKWAAAHRGQDRRLIHPRLQRATSVRSRVGIVLEDGSGVAIDWVTGRSYSSARRRLNVQSGQRKGRKGAAAPYPNVVDTEKVLREADGPASVLFERRSCEPVRSPKQAVSKKRKGIHDRFLKDIVIRNSKLVGPRRSVSRWTSGTERFHLSSINWGVWEIQEKLVYLAEHIWQKCTDETPIRLRRSINNKYAPSSPWVWRRATCTDSFLPVSEMAFVVFFIQYIMVAVEWPLVELMCEQHTSHVTSSRVSQHTFQCHIDTGARTRCVAHFTPSHPHALMMLCVAWFSTTLPSTLCFPYFLSSSFSFSRSSSSFMWRTRTLRTSANEDFGILAENDPLTEPERVHDNTVFRLGGDLRSVRIMCENTKVQVYSESVLCLARTSQIEQSNEQADWSVFDGEPINDQSGVTQCRRRVWSTRSLQRLWWLIWTSWVTKELSSNPIRNPAFSPFLTLSRIWLARRNCAHPQGREQGSWTCRSICAGTCENLKDFLEQKSGIAPKSRSRCWLDGKVQVHQKTTFIKNHFRRRPLSSKNHLHQKTTFIKKIHFHQKPNSSKTNFIKNQFHQKPISSETTSCQRDPPPEQKQYSPCLCESVAGRRPATPSHKHGLCPPLGFQQKGPLRVQRRVFRF